MKIIKTIKNLLPPKKEQKYLRSFFIVSKDTKVVLMSLRLLFGIESNEVALIDTYDFENETQNTLLLDVMLTEKQTQIFMDHMAKVFVNSEEVRRIV